MPKVASLFGLLEQLESSKMAVKQSRCVLVRNRNAVCLRCQEACTTGCISYDEEAAEVRISPEKCIGCGSCATACPTGALVPKDPDDSCLLREISQKAEACEGKAVVACSRLLECARGAYDAGKVTEVACLGRIDEGMVMALAAMGAERVVLSHGDCASCEHSQGLATTLLVRDNANTLLRTWGSPLCLKISGKLPSSVKAGETPDCDEGKRAFLTSARDESVKVASAAVDMVAQGAPGIERSEPLKYVAVGGDGIMPQFVPNRRRRLNAALRALGEPADEMIDTRLWGHVVIDMQACTSCRMCATFCPTGALRRFDEDDAMGVTHSPSLCVKCRMCESICPAHAVEISELVFAVDMLAGEVERYAMRPPVAPPDNPHQIHSKMKTLLNCTQVYER